MVSTVIVPYTKHTKITQNPFDDRSTIKAVLVGTGVEVPDDEERVPWPDGVTVIKDPRRNDDHGPPSPDGVAPSDHRWQTIIPVKDYRAPHPSRLSS